MTLEEAVRARLLAITAVTDLVGTRIYILTLPQTPTWPAIRVALIDEPVTSAVDGETALAQARIQVDAWVDATAADPYTAAATLATAIHGNGSYTAPTGLEHWHGAIGSPAVTVKGMERIDRTVSHEIDVERLVRVRQDYRVSGAA